MKIITTGQLLKILKEADSEMIFRKRNIRKFIKENVKFHYYCSNFVVDYEDFNYKINPKGIDKHYKIPRIRTMTSAVKEFNAIHKEKINIHTIEKCLKVNKNIPYIKGERLLLINYDILEKEILLQLKLRKNHKK